MAQIWMDDENMGAHVIPRSNRKIMQSDAMSAKKSVLSKLDNVIYNNKSNVTPFKAANQIWPINCAPKLSLCKETLQKQHRKQIHKEASHLSEGLARGSATPQAETAAAHDLYARSADPKDSFDLFDFMDFPSKKCLKNCHKSKSQKWSAPLLSDDLIEKLLNLSDDLEQGLANNSDVIVYEDLDTVDSKLKPLKFNINAAETEDNFADIVDDSSPPLPTSFDEDFDLF